MKAIIWTKNQCIYCEWAKNLLRDNEIEFDERNINDIWTKDQMQSYLTESHDINPENKITMPQIIVDDQYVGGFTELKSYFK
jgi:glutaredoxin 1